ncbi:hypothetical protein ACFFTN_01220 [Aminobacter aganoensis]|uniref:Uncharacterized protein n=1 Tax=Aminobacter aganoensis TaxID=83264 RepID=A0A7X0KJY9_9HYPH|nr:hypothetical protein [Aminobacter aganoensis]MBB6353521.1 hypothetical protein [Aminobacter aganoensis]
MTEDDLKDFLETNKAEIQAAVKVRMIENLLSQNQWAISGQIAKVVEEFVTAEIIPDVRAYLADNKGPLLQAAIAGAAEIGDTLSKAIVARTAKRLQPDNYEFRKVLEALFS